MEGIVINKDIIRALLYLPKYEQINKYHLNDYISDSDLHNMIIDFNDMLEKSRLSDQELLLIDMMKQEVSQKDIAGKLSITQSGISRKIDSIINKIYKKLC